MTGARTSNSGRLAHLAVLVVCTAVGGCALQRLAADRVGLSVVLPGGVRLLLAGALMSFGLALAALIAEFEEWRKAGAAGPRHERWRVLISVLVATWAAFLVWAQPFQRLWVDAALGLASGAFAGWVLAQGRFRWLRSPLAGRIERGLFALALALVSLEVGLRCLARVHPSQIFARPGATAAAVVERFKLIPGDRHYGTRVNSHGFPDREPAEERRAERLAVAIGDSFGIGVVPNAWHYTSVCEELTGFAVASLGVPGIGPPEYELLFHDEALPLDPDAILVGLFIGNDFDFDSDEANLCNPFLRSLLSRSHVLSWVVPERLSKVRAALREAASPSEPSPGEGPTIESREVLLARYPWLKDPLLEPPTFSEELFEKLELNRALQTTRTDPKTLPSVVRTFAAMHADAGPRPFVIFLIPDEFQVEDDLWSRVQAAAQSELERDRPQRRLAEEFTALGIPYLDLLPRMRAVEPLADGRRHLFHQRDTHLNARGNRIVGEALAEWIRSLPR